MIYVLERFNIEKQNIFKLHRIKKYYGFYGQRQSKCNIIRRTENPKKLTINTFNTVLNTLIFRAYYKTRQFRKKVIKKKYKIKGIEDSSHSNSKPYQNIHSNQVSSGNHVKYRISGNKHTLLQKIATLEIERRQIIQLLQLLRFKAIESDIVLTFKQLLNLLQLIFCYTCTI